MIANTEPSGCQTSYLQPRCTILQFALFSIVFLAACGSTRGSAEFAATNLTVEATSSSEGATGADLGFQHITLAFATGELVIELEQDAAPATVGRIREALIERLAEPESEPSLLIEQVWPQIEISTGLLLSTSGPVAQEIDARALGLHEELIETTGEAIDVLQFELAKADSKWKRDGTRPAKYQAWLDEYMKTSIPTQMLGTSRKEINELLGYRYVDGASSRRPTQGAVYLRPTSPTENQLALAILLTDRPQLTGRVTVVGRVIKGLDLARSMSNRPVVIQNGKRTKTPIEPPQVLEIRVE